MRAAARRAGGLYGELSAAAPAWLSARIVVLVALGVAHYIVVRTHGAFDTTQLHRGLLAWDGDWYRRIALDGYGHLSKHGLRFFPLYPLLARWVRPLTLGHIRPALLVVANVPALVFGALLYRLARRETGDGALASRAAWFVAVVPAAFVLVMAYAEPLFGCFTVATFLALRRRRWWWAAVAGFLAALTRPSGVLLALPALIEVARRPWPASWRDGVARATAVAGPVAGLGAFLAWVGAKFGDPMLPLRVQQSRVHRAGFENPVAALVKSGRLFFTGHIAGNGFHFPLAVVAVVLAVVVCRRWPASYGAYAVVSLLVALSARRLGSLERYEFGAFPVVLAVASVTAKVRLERLAIAVSTAAMLGLAAAAFLGVYVP